MPANLPPHVAKKLEELSQITDLEERIKAIREILSIIPKHKGTEKIILNLTKRLARAKAELEKRKKIRRGARSPVEKVCDVAVAVIGIENSGKSTFLNKVAGTKLDATEVPFETTEPKSGVVRVKGAPIQLIEIPSFYEGISSSKKALNSVIRMCDGILIILDPTRDMWIQARLIIKELEEWDIYPNVPKKKIKILRGTTGGIEIVGKDLLEGDIRDYIEVANEYGIRGRIVIGERMSIIDFVRAIDRSAFHTPAIFAQSKADIKKKHILPFSSVTGEGLREVLDTIYRTIGVVRIFTKEPRKEPSKEPLVFTYRPTVREVAARICKEWGEKVKGARVWGKSVKFGGSRVGPDFILEDGDIVELILRG